jgi:hypothetical protein
MLKTQIYLRKEELEALRRTAARSGRSVAEVVRDAIRKVVLKPSASGPVAIWDGEPKRASIEHDSIHDEPWCNKAKQFSSTAVRGSRWLCLAIRCISRRESNGTCFRGQGQSFIPLFPSSSRHSRFSIATRTVEILSCELRDLEQSWAYFQRPDLRKLSAVDATSFAIMKRARIRLAYAFDHHFAVVGFRLVG